MHPLKDGDEMFVDIGAYGNPSLETFEARSSCRQVGSLWTLNTQRAYQLKTISSCSPSRQVEDFVRLKHGYQMMYADSYMTREEFRQMFDHTVYDKLRKKLTNCLNAFPEVYDKVCKQNRI